MRSKTTALATIRKQKEMTQKQLAEASGVGESTIQLWEAGEVMSANLANLSAVAKVLGVDVTELLEPA